MENSRERYRRNSPEKFVWIFTTVVWLVNGFLCKILDLVPRHEAIVARILQPEHAREITFIIGVLEMLMAGWILSRLLPALCITVQVVLVLVMNLLEFFLAPDLLLFGRANLLVAFAFCIILFWQYRQLPKPAITLRNA